MPVATPVEVTLPAPSPPPAKVVPEAVPAEAETPVASPPAPEAMQEAVPAAVPLPVPSPPPAQIVTEALPAEAGAPVASPPTPKAVPVASQVEVPFPAASPPPAQVAPEALPAEAEGLAACPPTPKAMQEAAPAEVRPRAPSPIQPGAAGSTLFPGKPSSAGSTPFPGRPPARRTSEGVGPVAEVAVPITSTGSLLENARLQVKATPDRGKVLVSIDALGPGDLVLREVPVLSVRQSSASPTLQDLHEWADCFVALAPEQRTAILGLHCEPCVSRNGALADLMGPQGQKVDSLLRNSSVSKEDLWQFLRIMECNTFQVPEPDGMVRVEMLLTTSRLNHSCMPNALRGPGAQDGTIEVRALRPVAAGEELTISYVDEDVLLSPCEARRDRLESRWLFRCQCQRCSSPDLLRAFACPAGPMCKAKGCVHAGAGGGGLSACVQCGRSLPLEAASSALDAEARLEAVVPEAHREAMTAAGELNAAVQARDGPAFEKAADVAMKALGRCAVAAASCPEVSPAHFRVAALAKAAATLRTVLGDGLAAARKADLAKDMWNRAAGELGEAVANERRALALPRDGRVADLVGLSGIYKRLGREAEARQTLSDALDDMRTIYWACAPAQRASSMQMMKGVEEALNEAAVNVEPQ